MTRMTVYAPGTPAWVDLATTDLQGATDFYRALFGWDVQHAGPDAAGYSMATLDGALAAGLTVQFERDRPPAWNTYLAVADLDTTAERVETAGGKVVVPPLPVLDLGRAMAAVDPAGAPVSFWEAGTLGGAGVVNEPGTFCWNELTTRDVDTALAFYGAVLGWSAVEQDLGGTTYRELQVNGSTVAGLMPMEGEMWDGIPDHWMVYFAVADTNDAAARCTSLGGTVSVPPTDIPPGRFAVLTDPQGAVFSVITLATPPT